MNMHPPFPPHWRQDLRRGAEVVVHDRLVQNHPSGHAPRQLDFTVWVEGVGRVGVQVKGGRYSVDRAA